MLGHKLYQTLSKDYSNTIATFRKPTGHYLSFNFYDPNKMIGGIDVTKQNELVKLLNNEKPDVICNCIGKTTRKISPEQSHQVIYLNSYLPHLLSSWCNKNNAFFYHFSTDCVFSGKNGPYKTNDFTDSRDLYGLSKVLGETQTKNGLTVRTSIVGREIENKTEFFEWIFSSKNQSITGYKNVFYSGVTTNYLSSVILELIKNNNKFKGLYQIASPSISKFNLIKKLNTLFDLNIKVSADTSKISNKVLQSTEFQLSTGIKQQDWDQMLNQLKLENSFYENLNQLVGEKAA